ncbi:MAG: glycoside hydrolase family 2 TIM barrel-domain containing protein [bacterium]
MCTGLITPAAVAPLPPEIENERILGINKEPAHATLMPYASLAQALAGKRHESSWRRSLNGVWKFNWVARPEERPADFYKPGFNVSAWREIPVPSNWQVHGYGTPYYRNLGYTIQKDWPRVMTEPPRDYTAYEERNPVGSYRRDFDAPSDWKGRRVFLTFDGVDSAFFLWINGEKVGYSVNSRNAAEFDVTDYVKHGQKNVLAVEVYRYCAGSYLEDQDMWRLSGIFRNVTLWSAPQVHVRDYFIRTELDAQYRDATVIVTARTRNYGNNAVDARKITAKLYDADGRLVTGAITGRDVPPLGSGEETTIELKFSVANPDKWTAETPSLYTTVLTLSDDQGRDEILSARTGFRTVEIKGRVFMVNGVPVKLKGANRHEQWPETGHAITEEQMIRDLELLKQCNCNHVRTSHYSDDPRWYELCDEYGIYLVAEANVECHGYYGVLDREPRYETAIVDRNIANVQSFKNHPSVIMWSLGNENGGGSNMVSALKAIKAIDTSRPAHFESFGIGAKNPADVDSAMYTHPNDVLKIANDTALTKPFYMCEYAHAMNNSMGSIGDYNDLFDKYPPLMGGAIWEWQDQGLWNRRNPARQFIAYGGGFGEKPNDHYFIHKGVVFSDRSLKPHYPEVKKAYQWIGFEADDLARRKVRVRNKHAFISLGRFKGSWTVSEDGRVIDKGIIKRLNVAPGEDEVITIPFKQIVSKPGADYHLRLSFKLSKNERWARAGYEAASEQFRLPVERCVPAHEQASHESLKLEQDDKQVQVTGGQFAVTFDKTEGVMTRLIRDGMNLLAAGGSPRLHLWRAQHRNDDNWAAGEWSKFGLRSLRWKVSSFEAGRTGASTVQIRVVMRGEGESGFSVIHAATYTIHGDGSIVADNSITPQGPRIPFGRLGVRMRLDKRLNRLTYLGRGPMENYSDRKRGSDVGIYSSTVRQQLTPYAKPMECGNHEDVKWAELTGKGLPGLRAKPVDGVMQFSALPYTDDIFDPLEYSADLPRSAVTVLCLSARTLGVGSNSCGPRPLDSYLLWSDPAAFTYTLRLLPSE